MSPAWRTSRFPIGTLLLDIVFASGLRPDAFMQALGYRHPADGNAALDAWVRTGDGPQEFIDRLQASPFSAAREAIDYALDATRQMLREDEERILTAANARAREEFRPFVEAVMEQSPPMAIMGLMFANGWRRHRAAMPFGFETWDEARQQAAISGVVCGLYAGSGYRPTPLGEVLWYRFVAALDAPPVFYSVDGVREPDSIAAPLSAPGTDDLFCRGGCAPADEQSEWPLEEGEDVLGAIDDAAANENTNANLTDDGLTEGW